MSAIHVASLCALLLGTCSVTLAAQDPIFTADQLRLPGKKGACFTLRQSRTEKGDLVVPNMPRVKALNVSWNYSWGATDVPEQPADIEFVPMIWGASTPETLDERLAAEVLPHIKAGRVRRLLGFNEPDHKNQADMPYTKALELWPALEKLGIPLCSPACANPEGIKDDSVQGIPGTWMRDFMKEADKRGYRVDYIGVHWYGGTRPSDFKTKMRRIYERYGRRPLLITEFAPADWQTGGDVRKNRHTPADVLKFMKETLPWMEAQEWIAGYAWFSFRIDAPPGTSSALFDEAGNLTACGRYYRSVTPQTPQGDQAIEPDPARPARSERDAKGAVPGG